MFDSDPVHSYVLEALVIANVKVKMRGCDRIQCQFKRAMYQL